MRRWSALLLVLVLLPSGLRAQEVSDEDPLTLFLLLPVGAQAVGVARAMTALEGGESVWWNPAGLSNVEPSRGVLHRGDHPIAGAATAGSLILTGPRGVLAASYQLIDHGSQDLTDSEAFIVGRLTTRSHLAIVSAASGVGQHLRMGVNLKLIQLQLSCRGICTDPGVATTWGAMDVGAQIVSPFGLPLRLGAMVAHAGLDLGGDENAHLLPTRLRVAAAYEVVRHLLATDDLTLTVMAEVEDRWRNPGSLATYVGAEFAAGNEDALYLRAGYVANAVQQLDGPSVGAGLTYERFELGIAKSLASSLEPGQPEAVHITFGYMF